MPARAATATPEGASARDLKHQNGNGKDARANPVRRSVQKLNIE